jgi:hypothetical protein
MSEPNRPPEGELQVELRNPVLAALLAWLWPGAGHIYQGRHGKGALFMVCIMSTFLFGLWLGEGRTVYASNRTIARKLVYACQLGVGLPAMPALVQAGRDPRDPLWGGIMAPPIEEGGIDELSELNRTYGARYDMGVLYTMVAGLLNVLAIFDAYGGPLVPAPEEQKKRKPRDDTPGEPAASDGPPRSDETAANEAENRPDSSPTERS